MRCSPAVPRSDLERMRTAPAAEQRAEGGAHAGADSERAAARKLHMAGVRPASRRHGKRCKAPRAWHPAWHEGGPQVRGVRSASREALFHAPARPPHCLQLPTATHSHPASHGAYGGRVCRHGCPC